MTTQPDSTPKTHILIRHDDGSPALTLTGWDLADANSTGTLMPADLPPGWEGATPERLIESEAGRYYALRRWAHGLCEPADLPVPVREIDGDPPHPECYTLVFGDDSVFVASNANDEVWANIADYRDDRATH